MATKKKAAAKKKKAPARPARKKLSAFLETDAQVLGVVNKLRGALEVGFDTETTGLSWLHDRMLGMSVAADTDAGYFFFPGKKTAGIVTQLLGTDESELIGHNVKFDMHFLERWGVKVRGRLIHDTMVLARLLDENRPFVKGGDKPYGLKPLARDWFDAKATESLDRIKKWREEHGVKEGDFASVPKDLLATYGAEDARITLGLYRVIRQRLREAGVPDSLVEREARVLRLAYDMEARGVKVNMPFLKKYGKKLEAEKKQLAERLYKIAKKRFNLDSDDELRPVLLSLGWKPRDEDKSEKTQKDAVNKWALEHFHHEFVYILLDYRHTSKLLSTFVKGISERSHKGVVHPDFDTAGAVTGRWSCRNPNLQNIDNKSEARKAFVPRAGYDLWSFDFKQIEPTLAAHFSESYELKELFNTGGDFHSLNASKAYNIPLEQVKPDGKERKVAKALGLAILYGAGKDKAAMMMRVKPSEAKTLIDNYHKSFPAIKKLMRRYSDEVIRTAKSAAEAAGTLVWNKKAESFVYKGVKMPEFKFVPKRPGLKVLEHGEKPASFTYDSPWDDPNYWMFEDWGRLDERGHITLPDGRIRRLTVNEAYKALNSEIQGTAAYLLKEAMVRAEEAVPHCMLMQVHDEILFELPKGASGRKKAALIKKAMESLGDDIITDVPIKVDVAMSSKSWGDMKEVKL